MKYCTKCGKELFDEAVICPGCGCPAAVTPTSANHIDDTLSKVYGRLKMSVAPSSANRTDDILIKLSERLKINGIIWIVIAVLQIIIGLCGTILPLVVGILNIISAVKDLNYSKTVLENPNGIVKYFESLTSPIITLVYNLLLGGVIGVVGSIYYFIALRGFVMENESAFLALENSIANNRT